MDAQFRQRAEQLSLIEDLRRKLNEEVLRSQKMQIAYDKQEQALEEKERTKVQLSTEVAMLKTQGSLNIKMCYSFGGRIESVRRNK